MPKALIEIENHKRIRRELRNADPEIRKEVRELDKSIATKVADASAPFVPVRSGALLRSLNGGAESSGAYVKAGTKARVPYAPIIHWGWPARGIKRSGFIIRGLSKVGRETQGLEGAYLKSLNEIMSRMMES